VELKGHFRDQVGVVEVIQFLYSVRQTGRLVLTSDHRQAQLHCRKGQLVDVRAGDQAGTDALAEIVDWASGEFEFEPGVAAQEETLQMDLLHAVMHALKIRDERNEAERRKTEEELKLHLNQNSSLGEVLDAFASGADMIVYVGLADALGALLAEKRTAECPPGLNQLRDWLLKLTQSHPGPEFKKMFIEDEVGTAVIARAGSDRIAIIVADKSTPFGAVSLWANRLIAAITAHVTPQAKAAITHAN